MLVKLAVLAASLACASAVDPHAVQISAFTEWMRVVAPPRATLLAQAQPDRAVGSSTRGLCSWTRFSLAAILVLVGTAGAGRMAQPTSTRISARLKHV